jgi:hypothetical protein
MMHFADIKRSYEVIIFLALSMELDYSEGETYRDGHIRKIQQAQFPVKRHFW